MNEESSRVNPHSMDYEKNDHPNLLKSALVGLGLGIVQAIVAALFIPHTLEQRLQYIGNSGGLLTRYVIVIISFVVVVGLILKFLLKLPHPFRNAFYVPLLAESVAVVGAYKSSAAVFLAVTVVAFVAGQILWTYVARAGKVAQSVFVIAVIALALYSLAVLNGS